jgi:hypothetical protein
MVRCTPRPDQIDPAEFTEFENDEALNSPDPEQLKKGWLKESKACAAGGPGSQASCSRRLYLAKRLRGRGYCHISRRRTEDWARCE